MNNFEDQLDAIRTQLYEETKDMPKLEAIQFINEHAKKIALKYGITILKEPHYGIYRIKLLAQAKKKSGSPSLRALQSAYAEKAAESAGFLSHPIPLVQNGINSLSHWKRASRGRASKTRF
ncbi:hypothetical protein ACYULU_16290 [Breznakiellaceae bacterium SP9]